MCIAGWGDTIPLGPQGPSILRTFFLSLQNEGLSPPERERIIYKEIFMLFISMILLGAVIGFVGAGGAGVTITLLTVGFGDRKSVV